LRTGVVGRVEAQQRAVLAAFSGQGDLQEGSRTFWQRLAGAEPAPAGPRLARPARLGLAVTRGLLLDLVLTGDRAAADETVELFGRLLPKSGATPDSRGSTAV
jgi:hypothetical protein